MASVHVNAYMAHGANADQITVSTTDTATHIRFGDQITLTWLDGTTGRQQAADALRQALDLLEAEADQ